MIKSKGLSQICEYLSRLQYEGVCRSRDVIDAHFFLDLSAQLRCQCIAGLFQYRSSEQQDVETAIIVRDVGIHDAARPQFVVITPPDLFLGDRTARGCFELVPQDEAEPQPTCLRAHTLRRSSETAAVYRATTCDPFLFASTPTPNRIWRLRPVLVNRSTFDEPFCGSSLRELAGRTHDGSMPEAGADCKKNLGRIGDSAKMSQLVTSAAREGARGWH